METSHPVQAPVQVSGDHRTAAYIRAQGSFTGRFARNTSFEPSKVKRSVRGWKNAPRHMSAFSQPCQWVSVNHFTLNATHFLPKEVPNPYSFLKENTKGKGGVGL